MRFVQYNRPFFTKEQQTLLTITVLNNLLTVQPKHHLGKVEISKSKILWSLDGIWVNLGKLQYFTNLNLAAIKGDDFPYKNHDSRARSQSWWNLPRCYWNCPGHTGEAQPNAVRHVDLRRSIRGVNVFTTWRCQMKNGWDWLIRMEKIWKNPQHLGITPFLPIVFWVAAAQGPQGPNPNIP